MKRLSGLSLDGYTEDSHLPVLVGTRGFLDTFGEFTGHVK